ncbi:hypothetical protein [Streptomyces sp. NBC_01361]|uniref:hypothetical protein n=1 Tax=Streptomyces sp. NBC_01361 TaxID=2903838 RepID=UPI002E352E2F|nr:hypothetical protein [Streptomyces sp. NBC_01361]
MDTAFAVQQPVTAFATEGDLPRIDVEMMLKRIVRHPEFEAAWQQSARPCIKGAGVALQPAEAGIDSQPTGGYRQRRAS